MKYCSKCGFKNTNYAKFCVKCGNSFVAMGILILLKNMIWLRILIIQKKQVRFHKSKMLMMYLINHILKITNSFQNLNYFIFTMREKINIELVN